MLCDNLLRHPHCVSGDKDRLLDNNGEVVMELAQYPVQISYDDYSKGSYKVIISRVFEHDMAVLMADSLSSELVEVDMSTLETDVVLQLKEGEIEGATRWEGNTLNGKPFGYGTLYGKDDMKLYRGYVLGNQRVCYGIEYNKDPQNNYAEYCGTILKGVRHSRGCTYTADKRIQYSGEFRDGKPIETPSISEILMIKEVIPLTTNCIGVDRSTANEKLIKAIRISPLFHELEEFGVLSDSMQYVQSLVFQRLENLKSIQVGERCFTEVVPKNTGFFGDLTEFDDFADFIEWTYDTNQPIDSLKVDVAIQQLMNKRFIDYEFCVNMCPNLESIILGNESFFEYDVFKIMNVPSLKTVQLGSNSFYRVNIFVMKGMSDCDCDCDCVENDNDNE